MAEVIRKYVLGDINELPVKATTTISEGNCVGVEAASGYAREIGASTDLFAGFAERTVVNSGGNGAKNVRVIKKGSIVLAVTALAITNFQADVYADGPNTFTLVPADGPFVGKVRRFISSGIGEVDFDAASVAPGEDTV